MNDYEKGLLTGVGVSLGLIASGWFALRLNWTGVRAVIAANVDKEVGAQLGRPDARVYSTAVSTLLVTLTGKTLPQFVHENLSLAVADGIGDTLAINTNPAPAAAPVPPSPTATTTGAAK